MRVAQAIIVVVMSVGAAAAGDRLQAVRSPLLGVAYGNQGWEMNHVRALEQWQGRKHEVLVLFTNWSQDRKVQDNLFRQQLPAIWDNGTIPLITWEPFTGATTPANIVSRIASGEFDAYVVAWATRLWTFLAGADGHLGSPDDRRVYLRLAHEMNGDWYPWGQRSPERFIQMWRRVHALFDDLGLGPAHVQWMWCVTNVDHGPFDAEAYYPGDDWVDWVAIDGYNWGVTSASTQWLPPQGVLGPMLTRVRALTSRPVALAEIGTTRHTASGDDVQAKNEWIRQYFSWLTSANVQLVCWFNLDRDADFAVFGGLAGDTIVSGATQEMRAFSGYAEALRRFFPERQPGGPRLVTDDVFAGRVR